MPSWIEIPCLQSESRLHWQEHRLDLCNKESRTQSAVKYKHGLLYLNGSKFRYFPSRAYAPGESVLKLQSLFFHGASLLILDLLPNNWVFMLPSVYTLARFCFVPSLTKDANTITAIARRLVGHWMMKLKKLPGKVYCILLLLLFFSLLFRTKKNTRTHAWNVSLTGRIRDVCLFH